MEQDVKQAYKSAVRDQIYALERLNKAAAALLQRPGTTADAAYEHAVAACKEADALVAYWRARLRS